MPLVAWYTLAGATLGALLGLAGWELLPRDEPVRSGGGDLLFQGLGGHVARCTVAFGLAGPMLHHALHEERDHRIFFWGGFAVSVALGLLFLFDGYL